MKKTHIYLIILILISFSNIALSQTETFELMTPVEWSEEDLNASQFEKYQKLKLIYPTEEFTKVNLGNLSGLQNNTMDLSILQNSCVSTKFKGKHIEYASEEDYSWYGEIIRDDENCNYSGHVLLMSKNGMKFGQVQVNNQYYKIVDIEGKNAIIKLWNTTDNFGTCGVDNNNTSLDQEDTTSADADELANRSKGICNIRVLVLYTDLAEQTSVVEENTHESIAISNQILRNSWITDCQLRFELAGMEKYDYDETGKTYYKALGSISDAQHYQWVSEKKIEHHADIVVLFVRRSQMNHEGVLGIANVQPPSYLANAVCTVLDPNKGFVFTHEVGHILGALHEPCSAEIRTDDDDSCSNSNSYNQAHSFNVLIEGPYPFSPDIDQDFCTVLFSEAREDIVTIPFFSNPIIPFFDTFLGVENERDNTKQIKGRGCVVAAFEHSLDELQVGIDGPQSYCPTDFISFESVVSGINGAYTLEYEWKITSSGLSWDDATVVGTDANLEYLPNSSFPLIGDPFDDVIFVRLVITATLNSQVTQAVGYFEVSVTDDLSNCPHGGFHPLMSGNNTLNIHPNPAINKININFELEEVSNVDVNIYNSKGQRVKNKQFDKLIRGNHQKTIELEDNVSGVYYLDLIKGKEIERKQFILIKQ